MFQLHQVWACTGVREATFQRGDPLAEWGKTFLCTGDPYYVLYMALLISKCLKKYIMYLYCRWWWYVILCPCRWWLGRSIIMYNVYITSQYFSPNAKYWTASSGIRTLAPLIECGCTTIELWNLYIIWVCLRPSTSLQMPNIELHRPGIEPGPPLTECGHSTIELWNLYIIWEC